MHFSVSVAICSATMMQICVVAGGDGPRAQRHWAPAHAPALVNSEVFVELCSAASLKIGDHINVFKLHPSSILNVGYTIGGSYDNWRL